MIIEAMVAALVNADRMFYISKFIGGKFRQGLQGTKAGKDTDRVFQPPQAAIWPSPQSDQPR